MKELYYKQQNSFRTLVEKNFETHKNMGASLVKSFDASVTDVRVQDFGFLYVRGQTA